MKSQPRTTTRYAMFQMSKIPGHSARNALKQFDAFTARKIIELQNALLRKKMPNVQTVVVLIRQLIEAVRHISTS